MRIVLCLLLAVDTGEPLQFFHAPRRPDDRARRERIHSDLTGALAALRGIVKRVLLTSVGDFCARDERARRIGDHA
jgi:hypothetical protein